MDLHMSRNSEWENASQGAYDKLDTFEADFWRDGVGGESMSRKDLHRIVRRRANGQQWSLEQISDRIRDAA